LGWFGETPYKNDSPSSLGSRRRENERRKKTRIHNCHHDTAFRVEVLDGSPSTCQRFRTRTLHIPDDLPMGAPSRHNESEDGEIMIANDTVEPQAAHLAWAAWTMDGPPRCGDDALLWRMSSLASPEGTRVLGNGQRTGTVRGGRETGA